MFGRKRNMSRAIIVLILFWSTTVAAEVKRLRVTSEHVVREVRVTKIAGTSEVHEARDGGTLQCVLDMTIQRNVQANLSGFACDGLSFSSDLGGAALDIAIRSLNVEDRTVPFTVVNGRHRSRLSSSLFEVDATAFGTTGATIVNMRHDTFMTMGLPSTVEFVSHKSRNEDAGPQVLSLSLASDTNPSVKEFPAGDVDVDGDVDFLDFLILANNFASEQGTWETGDFDGDQIVGFRDFLSLANNFGTQVAFAMSVPEPNSLHPLMMTVAFWATLFRKVRTRRDA